MKEDEFVEHLDDLFDIAHSDALKMITIAEDRAFLLAQREKGRTGSIGAVDMVESDRRQRAKKRKEEEQKRRKRSQEELEACSSKIVLESDSSSSETEDDIDDIDYDEEMKSKSRDDEVSAACKRARINILSPGLSSALDRTKISSRNATFVLSEVASSLGHYVNTLNINRNSIQRARASNRATRSTNLRSEFSALVPLTFHWDGKLMEDLTSHEHEDRLPVLISGVGVE